MIVMIRLSNDQIRELVDSKVLRLRSQLERARRSLVAVLGWPTQTWSAQGRVEIGQSHQPFLLSRYWEEVHRQSARGRGLIGAGTGLDGRATRWP